MNANYERYLKNNRWFFASNSEMEEWASQKVNEGVLKRLWELIPSVKEKDVFGQFLSTFAYGFIPANWSIQDLTQVFKLDFLVNHFKLWELGPDYQI